MKKLIHGADITRFLNSRYWLTITAVAMIMAAIYNDGSHSAYLPAADSGIFGLTPPSQWTTSPAWSTTIGVTAVTAITALLYLTITTYNILRSMSLIYAAIFFTAMTACPPMTTHLQGGQILAFMTFGALMPIFATYQSPRLTRNIFLSFAITTTALIICCQATAWVMILMVMLAAIGQMRILSLRTLTAAIIGISTPVWILWGFGIIDSTSLQPPSAFTMSALPEWLTPEISLYLVTLLALWLGLSIFNMIRIYSYNARLRAYNGVFTLLGLATMLLICIDPANMPLYIPLMAGCLGLQAGHFFTINHGPRSWIGIIAVSLPFWAIYIWSAIL